MPGRENLQADLEHLAVSAIRHRALECFPGDGDHLKDVIFTSYIACKILGYQLSNKRTLCGFYDLRK